MKTSYFANKILDDNSSDMYLALFNGNPATDGVEIVQNGGRASLELGTANGGYISNGSSISFVADASNGSEKVANHWAVFDADTDGNMLYHFPISYDVLCEIGVPVPIGVGSLVLKEA